MDTRRPHDWSYDAIADVYATDMGQSMPFDDVGWYRSLCLRERGRVLELGCGTGRILIDLLRAGIDAIGADRSLPMLRRLRSDAQLHALAPALVQMDIARPSLASRFHTILLPYSLVTYLTDPREATQAIVALASLLEPDGCLVLDAFIPKPVTSFADFREDYRRPHGQGVLERHKRIGANADGTNRIERRYRIYRVDGTLESEFFTDETIRPCAPTDLAALGASAGLIIERWSHDYDASSSADGARFATVVLRAPFPRT